MDIIMKIDLIKFLNDFEAANPELERLQDSDYTAAAELYEEYGCQVIEIRPTLAGLVIFIEYQLGVSSILNYVQKEAEASDNKEKEAENEN